MRLSLFSKKSKDDVNLSHFQDPFGGSTKRINFGLWLVTNRRNFILGIAIVLVIFSAFFYSYSGYYYLDYFFGKGRTEIKMIDSLAEMGTTTVRIVAADLRIIEVFSICRSGRCDLVAKIANPNPNFSANLNYCFNGIACGSSFILPTEEKYLLILNQAVTSTPTNLTLNINNIAWRRYDTKMMPEWEQYKKEHLKLEFSNIKIKNAANSGLSDKSDLSLVSFQLFNASAFGYWQLPVNIFAMSGGRIVAVNRYSLANFQSGGRSDIQIMWPELLSGVSDVQIVPDVNILDDSVYIKVR